MKSKLAKMFCTALLGLSLLPLVPFSARADIISTQEAVAMESGRNLAQVDAWLMRDDVMAELASLGVDPELARIRAEALSPAELELMANQIEELPAGAGAIKVLGITFLVLLILELVGVTNIFNR